MPKMPQWKVPKNITKLVEDSAGIWEDDRWQPILLTVMSGTKYRGREIPLAWQIEFDPSDEAFVSANEWLEDQDIDSDGYGWGQAIQATMNDTYPELGDQLHFNDCEGDTCVVWVENEETCRKLIETTWHLVFKVENL